MDELNINGLILTPLKRIDNQKGNIWHVMKKNDPGYTDFGDVYFSTINSGVIKGWNKHKRMTLNLIVPKGEVEFVIYDDRKDSVTKDNFTNLILSPKNYQRLTIPPGLWVSFKSISEKPSWILNIADIKHDPDEMEKKPLDQIKYDWNC